MKVVLLLTACIAVSLCSCVRQQPPSVMAPPPLASAAPIGTQTPRNNITSEDQARVLVGLDDKERTAADAGDVRVKRVRYLLEELEKLTGEDLVTIAAATDSASNYTETKYDRPITRLRLLEAMKTFYSDPKTKIKPTYKEAITAHVLLEYAK
jgi:hypothetical protein